MWKYILFSHILSECEWLFVLCTHHRDPALTFLRSSWSGSHPSSLGILPWRPSIHLPDVAHCLFDSMLPALESTLSGKSTHISFSVWWSSYWTSLLWIELCPWFTAPTLVQWTFSFSPLDTTYSIILYIVLFADGRLHIPLIFFSYTRCSPFVYIFQCYILYFFVFTCLAHFYVAAFCFSLFVWGLAQ